MTTELMDAPEMTNGAGMAPLATKSPRRELFDGVQIVGKAVATRSSLPILMHVLIRQDEETGKVRLTGTDLEMWIEHTLPASQAALPIGGGAATAPQRNLAELLAAMPEADVELTTDAGRGGEDGARSLHLRCNRANYKLLGLAPDEFPLLPQIPRNTQFTVTPSALHNAIKQVLFAVSTDESRPILTGVLMIYKGGQLKLVATDTHRLAVRECDILGGTGADSQVVVPARALAEVQRLAQAGETSGDVTVTLSDTQVQFEIGDAKTGASTKLISRLIEGTFPSYERVVPQSYDRRLSIERDPLLSALRRAAIVAREGSANRVVLRSGEGPESDHLVLTAVSGNLGNAYEEVEIARDGNTEPVEIAFNAKYLIDVLNVLEGEGLHLELTEPLRPGVVRPSEDSSYFCVLMPMQVV
jgi:DNA polymerase III subunit beta